MSYITREDGEHFVIPSYRDVLTVKQKSQLKKDVLLLSQSYGEYITLQKKSAVQYEVAFSPDMGYLLGESIWHHFKKPLDMIYCEAIPNTTEALLVIVKSGSVYLDGSFPLDSIPEELIIFLTQQNNFEIYTYGDVPISATPEAGKFSFEANSVKSFTVLDHPVFATLPLVKIYQLQLVDPVLKEHGIGVFPTRQLLTILAIAGLAWMAWSYISTLRTKIERPAEEVNPYQRYLIALSSPAPDEEVAKIANLLLVLNTMPGWIVKSFNYAKGAVTAVVLSYGGSTEALTAWSINNNFKVDLKKDGIYLTTTVTNKNRLAPKQIFSTRSVISFFIDKLAEVYPGNHLAMNDFVTKGVITEVSFTINLSGVTPLVLQLIGKQLKDLPFVLQDLTLTTQKDRSYNGSISIDALGS